MNLDESSPEPRDRETREALAQFERALRNTVPPGSMARVHRSVMAELARRPAPPERMVEIAHGNRGNRRTLWLAAAAATLLAGTCAMWWFGHPPGEPPTTAAIPCPHGAKPQPALFGSPELQEFLKDPDRYPRICRCRPSYSGNLR